MRGVVTLIQYLLLKLCYYRDAHPVMEPYGAVLVDHKSQCFSHQYFFLNSLKLGVCGLCYANLLYKSRLCLHNMKGRFCTRGDNIEFQSSEFFAQVYR